MLMSIILASSTIALAPSLFVQKASAGTFPGVNGRIAFESTRDSNREIYTMSSDGSEQTRLTNNAADDYAPSWSPDGREIAFMRYDQIYIMNADGSSQHQFTNSGGDYPSWSPDGTKIAFMSTRDGNAEICVMNADGSNPTRLTNNPANDQYPSWGMVSVGTRQLTVKITNAVDKKGIEIPENSITKSNYIKITFETTGASTIQCSLDGQDFSSCTSPVTYSPLKKGDHECVVRATDAADHTVEDLFSWTINPSEASKTK